REHELLAISGRIQTAGQSERRRELGTDEGNRGGVACSQQGGTWVLSFDIARSRAWNRNCCQLGTGGRGWLRQQDRGGLKVRVDNSHIRITVAIEIANGYGIPVRAACRSRRSGGC